MVTELLFKLKWQWRQTKLNEYINKPSAANLLLAFSTFSPINAACAARCSASCFDVPSSTPLLYDKPPNETFES